MYCNQKVQRLFDLTLEYKRILVHELRVHGDPEQAALALERKKVVWAETLSLLSALDQETCPHGQQHVSDKLKQLANTGWSK